MNMRKTLIALAVVSGAFISGNVMASGWTPNGTGGSVELGGTLTPVTKATPWSVKVGGGENDLNAQIQKGQNFALVPVKKPVLFLGITPTDGMFHGQDGITPQIDYDAAVDIDGFDSGVTSMQLPVKDKNQNSIGYMEAKLTAAGVRLWKSGNKVIIQSMFANGEGYAFNGGVGKNSKGVLDYEDAANMIEKLDPEITKSRWKYDTYEYANRGDFTGETYEYQGYYGSGLMNDSVIKINLNKPLQSNDSIEWHASLPVTVSYQ